jgi:catalase
MPPNRIVRWRAVPHAKGVCAKAEFEVLDVLGSVPDRALAARLATGLYATPGRYPATVRFANADSNINHDLKADVRAMSFAVEAPGRPRQDYSTNDRTTFPDQ